MAEANSHYGSLTSRVLACERCRGQKLRCVRDGPNRNDCRRCLRAGATCTTAFRPRDTEGVQIELTKDCGGFPKRRKHTPEIPLKEAPTNAWPLTSGSGVVRANGTATKAPPSSPNTTTTNSKDSNICPGNYVNVLSNFKDRHIQNSDTRAFLLGTVRSSESLPDINNSSPTSEDYLLPQTWLRTVSSTVDKMAESSDTTLFNFGSIEEECQLRPSTLSPRSSWEAAGNFGDVMATNEHYPDYSEDFINHSQEADETGVGLFSVPKHTEVRQVAQDHVCTSPDHKQQECLVQLSNLSIYFFRLLKTTNCGSCTTDKSQNSVHMDDTGKVEEASLFSELLKRSQDFLNLLKLLSLSPDQGVEAPDSWPSETGCLEYALISIILTCHMQMIRVYSRIFRHLYNQLKAGVSNHGFYQPLFLGLKVDGMATENGHLEVIILTQVVAYLFARIERSLGMPLEYRLSGQGDKYQGLFNHQADAALLAAAMRFEDQTENGDERGGIKALKENLGKVTQFLNKA